MLKNLKILPKLRDSLSFLYVEHAIIEQEDLAIVMIRKEGRTPIPIASLTTLMIGPGVSITHAAIRAICGNGCLVIWCGERASRFYASGMGETRSAANLLLQARLCVDEASHMEVVRRMYTRRFPNMDCGGMSLRQIRGLEGIRMREAYKVAAKVAGISWKKREYNNDNWEGGDDVNRAVSYANVILYGLCHAAIVSLGFSTGLGFVHTGKMLSFVYDIADLYKVETTIPAAFLAVASASGQEKEAFEKKVRVLCRQRFSGARILKRIPEDIAWIFSMEQDVEGLSALFTGDLWDGEEKTVEGGKNYAGEKE
ncbi:MAG: type I-E CRISPR-associated endonuclease Cas1e [Synergistaceae bacterium]|jgi:CRISPR-associated protein Cas1|nr:type I-E CRISPR-associated endonuclease Cas1e [Synergistaceae bacterium]